MNLHFQQIIPQSYQIKRSDHWMLHFRKVAHKTIWSRFYVSSFFASFLYTHTHLYDLVLTSTKNNNYRENLLIGYTEIYTQFWHPSNPIRQVMCMLIPHMPQEVSSSPSNGSFLDTAPRPPPPPLPSFLPTPLFLACFSGSRSCSFLRALWKKAFWWGLKKSLGWGFLGPFRSS